MNKLFSFILSFSIGMMIFIPTFSYIKSEKEKYLFPPTVMLYPKSPYIECERDINCKSLAKVAYYESRNQGDDGMLAVMKVVLNRANHDKWPNDIKVVIFHKCQFSFTCDGSMNRGIKDTKEWGRSKELAYNLLHGYIDIDLMGSTHYHTIRTHPYWANKFTKTLVIEDHVFYRCTGYC